MVNLLTRAFDPQTSARCSRFQIRRLAQDQECQRGQDYPGKDNIARLRTLSIPINNMAETKIKTNKRSIANPQTFLCRRFRQDERYDSHLYYCYVKHENITSSRTKRTKLMAHDPGTKKIGDKATIEARRPLSKRKAFKVIA